MTWEHYELYAVYDDGEEELIDTDGSVKKLRELAEFNLSDGEGFDECVIYQETEDGELIEVERISK